MKRAIVTAVVTLLLGAYLSLPALMFFDCSQQVVVLPRPHIDRLIVLSKKAWARHKDVNGLRNRRTQDSLLELAEIENEMESIEAEGRCGYRVVSQELFLEGYQTPHIARTLFPWVRHAGRIFERDADEYLVWLWFTIVCLNVVLLAYSKIHKRWEGDLKVVAWARWLLFCACAMAASMSLIALINYQIDLRALKVLSLVFSGPAYVYDQYGYSISWIWDERLILYSGIQWLLIGLVGCIVIKWLRGRHLPWCIIATLAACAGLGLGLADVPDRSGPVLLYGAHDARRDGPHPLPLPPGEGEIQRPAAREPMREKGVGHLSTAEGAGHRAATAKRTARSFAAFRPGTPVRAHHGDVPRRAGDPHQLGLPPRRRRGGNATRPMKNARQWKAE